MEKHLHIVTHDVPWPADYGGVIDPFYKIRTLHRLGIRIHLHCFQYGRSEAGMLDRYCASVTYYKRKTGISELSLRTPYIVSSRINSELISNFSKDNYPILFEGIHTSHPLLSDIVTSRKTAIRLFNVENEYYKRLSYATRNPFAKSYYFFEGFLLKKYEQKIASRSNILCMSESDESYYKEKFHAQEVHFIPAFVPWNKVSSETGNGNYCLYHGNLEVAENEKAALWLLENVFHDLEIPFVVAGKNPSAKLKKAAHAKLHTCYVENPSEFEMEDLIKKAQVNILPSFNNTGIKLKLLHAMFTGRHCLVNQAAIKGSAFESLCHVAENAGTMQASVTRLYNLPFTEEDLIERKKIMEVVYNNDNNAAELIRQLY